MPNIKKNILSFFEQLINDENHRYKSWEHCYLYFSKPKEEINIDIACLHLSFYLASWGMYRGSSFLLWQDYLIHKEVVKEILKYKHLQEIDFSDINKNSKEFKEIFELSNFIKNWYPQNVKKIPEKPTKDINVTDTLLTKILLGTLGCIPAYDRFFLDGLKMKNIRPYTKLSEKNFLKIIDFYNENKQEFLAIQQHIKEKINVEYPVMKLVDMYFFILSYSSNKTLDDE